ncbi:MAG TPA: segregation/condensation protein A [Planctomycetota bacterium]|nr:segregation/condensation protein A [Planctomycetota bacterium]HRR81477.1 segregation/condensation protein A [Planctomycetota bacterium]
MSSYEEESYGYKVDLEAFSGPLDLLLYLIRQEEVEIADIPIARITDQYLQHLEVMQQVNVNLAGEFLVMAATLMEIKSRMLLPQPEREGDEEQEDPRADLIRQLIEYKRFKDAARALAARADEQALKFTRGAAAALGLPERAPEENLPILLGEVTVWDLVAAFKVILSQTTLDPTRHIVLDERPASAYCNDLLDELRSRRHATLRELFNPADGRLGLIHAFMALLELIRRRRVRAEQAGAHGDIRIVLLDDTPLSETELVAPTPPPPEPEAPEATPPEPAPPPAAAASDEDAAADTEVEDIAVPEVAALGDTDGEPPPAAGEETHAVVEDAVPVIPLRPEPAPRVRKRKARATPIAPAAALALRRRHRQRTRCLLARFARLRPLASTRRVAGPRRRR